MRFQNPAAGRKSRPRLTTLVGNVVEMNAPTRRRRRSSRTALVLGGGGFTGGVYQIGALRALDLLSSNRSVNQFDIYVGTSAGALIASLVANGVTPEEMMRTVNDQVPYSLPPLDREMLLRFNRSEFAMKALKLPLHAISVARSLVSSLGSLSAVDLVLALADALPSGIYTGEGVEDYLREALAGDGRTDDFRLLQRGGRRVELLERRGHARDVGLGGVDHAVIGEIEDVRAAGAARTCHLAREHLLRGREAGRVRAAGGEQQRQEGDESDEAAHEQGNPGGGGKSRR